MRLTFAVALTLLSQGCVNCTLMGCGSGVTIDLVGALDPGEYAFEITADGDTYTCSFELGVDSCEGNAWVQVYTVSEQGFMVLVEGEPESVVIVADLDGQPLIDVAITPTYSTVAPNGERCGPICTTALAEATY